jgi:hypothetical protein
MPKEEKPLLQIKISGPGVKRGRIALPVLLRLCREAQAAVNRQAEAIETKKSGRRTPELIERECTLELMALGKGSTRLDFGPVNKQGSLFSDMAAMGIEAVSAVANTLRDVQQKRGKWHPPDARLLDALDDLGGVFEEGVDKVQWIVPRRNGHKAVSAELVPATLKKIRRRKQESLALEGSETLGPSGWVPPPPLPAIPPVQGAIQESFLEGMLEPVEGKVRVIPAVGAPATVTYSADQFENVREALHKAVRVKVDPKGRRLVDIEITAQDFFGSAGFFAHKSIDELRAEQGVPAVTDLEALGGLIPEEDLEEFVADIYRDREG